MISEEILMKNKRYSDAQIMGILKQAEGRVPVSELKAMAEENRRLKRMYAEMSMQNDLLKEALGKKR
jgi:putative transposase